MKILPFFVKLSAGPALALAGCVLVGGCGKNQDEGATAPPLPQPKRSARPQAEHSPLQSQMENFADIPWQHEPAKRPLVTSERISDRKAWLLAILRRGYSESAHTNSQWDAPADAAMQAYVTYSRVATDDRNFSALTNAVLAAAGKGCDDPMIQYMLVRYGLCQSNQTRVNLALASMNVFRSMLQSRYHPLLKFMAGFRAVNAAKDADPKGNRSVPIGFVTSCLEDLARDTNAPREEVFDAVSMWVDHSNGIGWAAYVMSDVEDLLQQTWGHEEPFYRLRGQAEIDRAWKARGGDYANTVTDQGWRDFANHLNQAALALETAWQMNPSNAYTAYLMMKVELGQGQGRARMQKWFNRAMNLYTNYYEAAHLMSFYLEPRWYGSDATALAFARSCVSSTNWGGNVPLVLADLHRSLAGYYKLKDSPQYWQKPGVWEDVHASYERFFQLNPDNYGYRHDYARAAYLCGQYQQFLAQAKLFPWTNFEYFGGETEFRKMLTRASAGQ